jgi:hypothetical protein
MRQRLPFFMTPIYDKWTNPLSLAHIKYQSLTVSRRVQYVKHHINIVHRQGH